MKFKKCSGCKTVKPMSEFNKNGHKKFKDGHGYYCRDCTKIQYRKYATKHGIIGMTTNRKCTQFLGIHVAERVLSKVFDEVKQMPFGNKGYDFTCKRGYKIDVKSSCIRIDKRQPNGIMWKFHIEKNKIADYFLLIGFDNRENLEPMHLWLIPANELNDCNGAYISKGTLNKWSQWERPIDDVISCCNTLRDASDEYINTKLTS